MFEFIQGEISEINPSYVVINTGGTGYFINISLTTFTALNGKENARLFIHQVIREDAHLLFGFFSKYEREVFRQLISVSGIGANTARMMLSSLEPDEVQKSIIEANVDVLKSVKGVGLKTAQRVIVELKDKLGKTDLPADLFVKTDNTIKEEALSALVMLGFTKNNVAKVLDQLFKDTNNKELKVEEVIKKALKKL